MRKCESVYSLPAEVDMTLDVWPPTLQEGTLPWNARLRAGPAELNFKFSGFTPSIDEDTTFDVVSGPS